MEEVEDLVVMEEIVDLFILELGLIRGIKTVLDGLQIMDFVHQVEEEAVVDMELMEEMADKDLEVVEDLVVMVEMGLVIRVEEEVDMDLVVKAAHLVLMAVMVE